VRTTPLIFAIVSFILAAVIFIFADGARRWYSGGFFLIIGVALLLNAKRSSEKTQNSQ
jgi:putative Ca2+/H+ antiporter (TMEM165/GDT1 family)